MTGGCEWSHAPEACAEDFWGFEKSQWVEFPAQKKMVDFRGSPKPGQWPCGRCCTWFGADGKVSIERWYLSPYVEKPFNSKVIKSFVPEHEVVNVFLCFGIPMLSIYELWTLWTFYVPVWVCLFHIFWMAMLQMQCKLKKKEILYFLILPITQNNKGYYRSPYLCWLS